MSHENEMKKINQTVTIAAQSKKERCNKLEQTLRTIKTLVSQKENELILHRKKLRETLRILRNKQEIQITNLEIKLSNQIVCINLILFYCILF